MTLKSPALIFMFGILVGAGLATAILRGSDFPMINTATNQTATTTSALPPPSNAVEVVNQAAGASVIVEAVTVPPPGVWVAVQELNSDNTIGNVLGASRVRGPRSNVAVSLLRNTVSGHRYVIVLYRDDGDETFTLAGDSAYIDFDTGDRVVAPFTAL